MIIRGIPSEVFKTYKSLEVKVYEDEVALWMAQDKGYVRPMIIVKKQELVESLGVSNGSNR